MRWNRSFFYSHTYNSGKCEYLFTGNLLRGILSNIYKKRHHRCLLSYIFYATVALNGIRPYHTFLLDSFCAISSPNLLLQFRPKELPGFTVASTILCYKRALLPLNDTGFTLLLSPAQGQSA